MNTGLKITAFAAAVAATFGTTYAVGASVDTVGEPVAHSEEHGARDRGGRGDHTPGGLQIAADGYALDLRTPRAEAGDRTDLHFRILKSDSGRAVTAYARDHGKELHLIVASRDLTTYRHLHPTRSADGTWSVPATLPKAGDYRVFADFRPERAKEKVTLGADLAVTGAYAPAPTLAPAATAKLPGGYEVRLDGALMPGEPGELTLRVTRRGKPVTDLQPYLGAYGHLVALRSGDLAYLHVHPGGEPGDAGTEPGPEVSFTATAPSAGTYRLFLDFRHEGKVRTAPFTLRVGEGGGAAHETPTDGGSHGH
ncbi:hypothetical protein [Streptomyces spectabilis]|uniref:DUF748 domain-containing protein n=1 Tax=Streptomyces spectabilis TaxID=68270 RepID=A0A5P2XAI1_STRST|nr:hypothetical protein [Streptomyces spectabilis]MBB5106664.1 hypothetical protein [Streptomyces spectabilis]MCI3903479.1 hypothetical protein [Streptomyces spectabilis]QEV60684.1 hypothetical protein CP982_19775 [Streptomyces spectabilis]GGV48602.1 hypothetical protein GCM10010245_76600 [Streptomyces spectabilis]